MKLDVFYVLEPSSSGPQDKYKSILRAQRTESPHRNKQRETENTIKLKKQRSGSDVLASGECDVIAIFCFTVAINLLISIAASFMPWKDF